MNMNAKVVAGIAAVVVSGMAVGIATTASDNLPELELRATQRVAWESGLRTKGILRSPDGKYLVLNERDRTVWMYDKGFGYLGQSAGFQAGRDAVLRPVDFALTADGKIVVADFSGDAVKIFDPEKGLVSSFSFRRANSVAVLSTGEILVSGMPGKTLIYVFSPDGKFLRKFGEPLRLEEDEEPFRTATLNMGDIFVDRRNQIYFLFKHFPKPTIRKYSHSGELLAEFHPRAEGIAAASERAYKKQAAEREEGGYGMTRVFSGISVDERTGKIWVSGGQSIYRLSPDGAVEQAHRFHLPDGRPTIVEHFRVEDDRMIVVAGLHGVYSCVLPSGGH